MRYAIISDVHANLEALNNVLKKIEEETCDELMFLGDSVGYGPNPNECIYRLKEKTKILLAGNHDMAAVGTADIKHFNPYARATVEWTQEILSNENRSFLNGLPLTEEVDDSILLVHSTPKEPEKWHYLLNAGDADSNFSFFSKKICFVGHSHIPFIIEQAPGGNITIYKDRADIKKRHRYIINAGSVGQPRDSNPDAAYALLNKNYVEIKRVTYDIVLTQKKMRDAGLPSFLIERLSRGI
ncbi:MAG: metallophosphoesterase family protein [Thermodesulfovibrionia bacterium]